MKPDMSHTHSNKWIERAMIIENMALVKSQLISFKGDMFVTSVNLAFSFKRDISLNALGLCVKQYLKLKQTKYTLIYSI